MNEIERQLEAARQNLLDLTRRNRLLNFRSTKSRTIEIIGPIAPEIGKALVSEESYFSFSARGEIATRGKDSAEEIDEFQDSENPREADGSHRSVSVQGRSHSLQTTLDELDLGKRLLKVYRQSLEVLEEQGYSILFLALGLIKWTEAEQSEEFNYAPLILIPVELERIKLGSVFKLRWTGEEVVTNISLKSKLVEQSIQLPDLEVMEDSDFVTDYFELVENAIAKMANWKILRNCYLDFFSFSKFIMYKDLDPSAWPEGTSPVSHPLMEALFAPRCGSVPDSGFDETEIDERLRVRNCFHIMDADPSQIAVIEDAKTGRNLAVEGPPGTGKSQTISNLIAELLALGKNVLFISEKMAALEVVKRRLDSAGLGDFCLELHSRKSRKKEVLRELERTIYLQGNHETPIEEEYDQVESLRLELNEYAKALRTPVGRINWSPFKLFEMREEAHCVFAKQGRAIPKVTIQQPEECSSEKWQEALSNLIRLSDTMAQVQPIISNPWRCTEPDVLLPQHIENIGNLIIDCELKLLNLEEASTFCETQFGIHKPNRLEDLAVFNDIADLLIRLEFVNPELFSDGNSSKFLEFAEETISLLNSYEEEHDKCLSKFDPKALDEEIPRILDDYRNESAKFLRVFSKKYRSLKRQIRQLYCTKSSLRAKNVITDLEQLSQCINKRQEIRQHNTAASTYFGPRWKVESTNSSDLREFIELLDRFKALRREGSLTDQAEQILSSGVIAEKVVVATRRVNQIAEQFKVINEELVNLLKFNHQVVFGTDRHQVPFSIEASRYQQWKNSLSKLREWSNFISACRKCEQTIVEPLIGIVKADQIEPTEIVPCFKANFADGLLNFAFSQRIALAQFHGPVHEKKIDRFRYLDLKAIRLNCRRLVALLKDRVPKLVGSFSNGSEAGILMSELNRKRGHKPIRKLMSLAGGLIQKIKPCFMMSPLSVAQFLDPRTVRFDIIIFDEGSQVRPEDALGSILRGNQLVVAGDSQQLPPTSFFDHILESAEDEQEDSEALASDMESILRLCRVRFPFKYLRWHYRSHHESLIAVSNQEFYDNRLRIYPSSIETSDSLGLEFRHLPHATYDRGRSSVNRIEAQEVARAAFEHYRHFPGLSLGIGTFNIKQQLAIHDEIEILLQQNPEIEDSFSSTKAEPFFVKNLETLQGDERDVIFLSVGFGKDDNGKLSLNFGPLNQKGGERRLNVLVTRARRRCVVFCNFRAADMALDGNQSIGVRCLKVFLEYAETKNLSISDEGLEDADSPFEEAVAAFVKTQGLEVRKQVGCAGFRVDLGVVDPDFPGKYLMGIECDGAKYHNSTVARDRDRLRQQILEQKGWTIHRVWSTDWYRSRSESENRILLALEKSKAKPRPDSRIIPKDRPRQFPASVEPQFSRLWTSDLEWYQNKAGDARSHRNIPVKDPIDENVCMYESCNDLGIFISGPLHLQNPDFIAMAVVKVVDVEAPVHLSEITTRIRACLGVHRAGNRIQAMMNRAINSAKRQGKVRLKDDFLWTIYEKPLRVRNRDGLPNLRIELICAEEISEAVQLVLRKQFATSITDLITESARLFGFRSTRSNIHGRIETVIRHMLASGILQESSNGMIDLPRR